MDKLVSEYRRPIGDFEVIDFRDGQVLASLRDEVDVPVDLHWTWSCDSEIDDLRRLYEKGKRGPVTGFPRDLT
ncbi:MAG TPA: hypothetical protein EYQ54_01535 [Myxococcales bacterium]|nr:hypothetical protein [Myxococcales bacterium]